MDIQSIMQNVELVFKTTDTPAVVYRNMREAGVEVAPVTDEQGRVAGLVWRSDILKRVPPVADAGLDDELDEALDETFPASDPISPAR